MYASVGFGYLMYGAAAQTGLDAGGSDVISWVHISAHLHALCTDTVAHMYVSGTICRRDTTERGENTSTIHADAIMHIARIIMFTAETNAIGYCRSVTVTLGV